MTTKGILFSTIFSTLLIISSSEHAHNDCTSRKLENCFCGKTYYFGEAYFLVNCTNTRFTDTSMLKELPVDTGALIFTGNNVESLPENIFGDEKNYTKLKVIDMSNNHIRNILGKTFHHVPNVETLILNHNDIRIAYDDSGSYHHPRMFSNFINLRELHLTNAFADNTDDQLANDLHEIFDRSNLTKLIKLHLEQNEIRHFIDPKIFCRLPSLIQLYLGNNFLTHVDFDSFKCLRLQFLDLENNTITELSDYDLEALDALYDIAKSTWNMTVDLNGNPLKCSEAGNLYSWLLQTKINVRHKEKLQCYISSGNTRHAVNLADVTEAKHEKLSKAITVLLVVLGLVLVSLIGAYAYIHRDKLKHRMSPILDVVSRKVHYTTIESQIV